MAECRLHPSEDAAAASERKEHLVHGQVLFELGMEGKAKLGSLPDGDNAATYLGEDSTSGPASLM
jgi:hypothetical protein